MDMLIFFKRRKHNRIIIAVLLIILAISGFSLWSEAEAIRACTEETRGYVTDRWVRESSDYDYGVIRDRYIRVEYNADGRTYSNVMAVKAEDFDATVVDIAYDPDDPYRSVIRGNTAFMLALPLAVFTAVLFLMVIACVVESRIQRN